MTLRCKRCRCEEIKKIAVTEDTIGEVVGLRFVCSRCRNEHFYNINNDEEEEDKWLDREFEVIE